VQRWAYELNNLGQQVVPFEKVESKLGDTPLTKDLHHVTFGIKVTDSRANDPRDGSPLSYCKDGIFGIGLELKARTTASP
jgi:hypothetical protein